MEVFKSFLNSLQVATCLFKSNDNTTNRINYSKKMKTEREYLFILPDIINISFMCLQTDTSRLQDSCIFQV